MFRALPGHDHMGTQKNSLVCSPAKYDIAHTGRSNYHIDQQDVRPLEIDQHSFTTQSDNVYEDLLDFVWRLHMDPDRDIVETLDPFIASTAATDIEYWRNVLHLALLCCHPVPDCRPSMRHVVQVLRSCH